MAIKTNIKNPKNGEIKKDTQNQDMDNNGSASCQTIDYYCTVNP